MLITHGIEKANNNLFILVFPKLNFSINFSSSFSQYAIVAEKNFLCKHFLKIFLIFYVIMFLGDYNMATSKDYKDYILDQFNILDGITCRPMMGEYLLYYNNVLFGGIYDNRLLVKIVDNNKKYNMEEAIPYDGTKVMFLVDDIDNKDLLKSIVLDTYSDLK
jgi:hypothetical protein